MEQLLKTWKLRMVKYRQEADNANTPITRVKAMNKFFIYRDCIKELEEAINYNRCCKSDSELLVCTYCGIQTNQETCPHPKKCAGKEKIKAN